MSYVISLPDDHTTVLLVHAPFPGRLKFDGEPSSLLYAVSPFVHGLANRAPRERVGLLDPRESSEGFYAELRAVLARAPVRVVCISTSSAAVRETARIVRTVRDVRGGTPLVVVGGPHEDDCENKVATHIAGVDLSMGGEPELLLEFVLLEFLAADRSPAEFCRYLETRLSSTGVRAGRGDISSAWWSAPKTRNFDFGNLELDALSPRCRSGRALRFSAFNAPRTLPVMVSRGCAYGQCTFCAEGHGGRARVLSNFAWLKALLGENPSAALYFQDSVFPSSPAVRKHLLPLLGRSGVEWGCQVYLPMLSEKFTRTLAEHGCRYIYTGLESGDEGVLHAIGKSRLSRELLLERLGWIREHGIRVGLSVMFGALGERGELLENEESIEATMALCAEIRSRGVRVVGFYPNIETVLPGTRRARSLEAAGTKLDWYCPPRCGVFEELEDGAVGFNFLSLVTPAEFARRQAVASRVRSASLALIQWGSAAW